MTNPLPPLQEILLKNKKLVELSEEVCQRHPELIRGLEESDFECQKFITQDKSEKARTQIVVLFVDYYGLGLVYSLSSGEFGLIDRDWEAKFENFPEVISKALGYKTFPKSLKSINDFEKYYNSKNYLTKYRWSNLG